MSHSNTARMADYWQARREGEAVTARAAIDPADFYDLVTQAFVIGRRPSGAYPFRLAGALLEDLHRGPLLGSDFVQLWAGGDRPRIQAVAASAVEHGGCVVLTAHGRTAGGGQARFEILLAPLAGPNGQVDRLLGFYQPTSPLFRLQNQRIERLFLLEAAFADGTDAMPQALRLASVDGRLIA